MATPTRRDLPHLPEGYLPEPGGDHAGAEPGFIEWSVVDRRLTDELHYWLATTRPDGRPHVVPRWGAWIDGRLYYDGSPETVHARNLAHNPACVLHIGDGKEAIMLEGRSRRSEPLDIEAGQPVAAEIGRKYGPLGYAPPPDAWSGPDAGGLCVFTPAKALAWFDFPNDLTRFHFP